MSFLSGLYQWLASVIMPAPPPPPPPQPPPPPSNAWFGYRWQPGQGVPAHLALIDETTATGVYVAFNTAALVDSYDAFYNRNGQGTVYVPPGTVSAALQQLVAAVAANPPVNDAYEWQTPADHKLPQLDGFLRYAATCLDLIDGTPSGHPLMQQLGNGPRLVIVSPSPVGNQTGGVGLNRLASTVVAFALNNEAIDGAAIDTMVTQHYPGLATQPARYAALAADLNNMPLYTLFETQAAFAPAFLAGNFTYNGAALDGPMLQNWLTGGDALFPAFLRANPAPAVNGVPLRDFLLMALIIQLYGQSPAGPGAPPRVYFDVNQGGINDPANAGFRPPAIGLAHELMHALHYTGGTAPGRDLGHFSTTAAELLFVGLGAFAGQPVSENTVRNEWHIVNPGAPDSNHWPAPAPRLIYDDPAPDTPAELREHSGMI